MQDRSLEIKNLFAGSPLRQPLYAVLFVILLVTLLGIGAYQLALAPLRRIAAHDPGVRFQRPDRRLGIPSRGHTGVVPRPPRARIAAACLPVPP